MIMLLMIMIIGDCVIDGIDNWRYVLLMVIVISDCVIGKDEY